MSKPNLTYILHINEIFNYLDDDDVRTLLWVNKELRNIAIKILKQRSEKENKKLNLNITLKGAHKSLSVFKQQSKLNEYYLIKFRQIFILKHYATGNVKILDWILNKYKSEHSDLLLMFRNRISSDTINQFLFLMKKGYINIIKYLFSKKLINKQFICDTFFTHDKFQNAIIKNFNIDIICLISKHILDLKNSLKSIYRQDIKIFYTDDTKLIITIEMNHIIYSINIIKILSKLLMQPLKDLEKMYYCILEWDHIHFLERLIEHINRYEYLQNILIEIPYENIMWLKEKGIIIDNVMVFDDLHNITLSEFTNNTIELRTLLYLIDNTKQTEEKLFEIENYKNVCDNIIRVMYNINYSNIKNNELDQFTDKIIIKLLNYANKPNFNIEATIDTLRAFLYYIISNLNYINIIKVIKYIFKNIKLNNIFNYKDIPKYYNNGLIKVILNPKVNYFKKLVKYSNIITFLIENNYNILNTPIIQCMYNYIREHNLCHDKNKLMSDKNEITLFEKVLEEKLKRSRIDTTYNEMSIEIIKYNQMNIIKYILGTQYSTPFVRDIIVYDNKIKYNKNNTQIIKYLDKKIGDRIYGIDQKNILNTKNKLLEFALKNGDIDFANWIFTKYKDDFMSASGLKTEQIINCEKHIYLESYLGIICKNIFDIYIAKAIKLKTVKWIIKNKYINYRERMINNKNYFIQLAIKSKPTVMKYLLINVLNCNYKDVYTKDILNITDELNAIEIKKLFKHNVPKLYKENL